MEKIKILIVEDEMIIGANIALQLTNLGYDVLGVIPRAEEVLPKIHQTLPDILLLDIYLKGDLDGIELAHIIQKEFNIPIIYLTANADEAHFNRAKTTNPYAFISKPFKKLDLQHAIELTILRIQEEKNQKSMNWKLLS
ncbi:response regulator [Flavobacterium piscinae]|uniref:response regulator n=1 Tax=Flavobacterium piscinae TaxID=2506424 RepID=UPI002AAC206E|nr:response regulator [Flavobacterium piscinae]